MINTVALVGRIATDPENRTTTSGSPVANFRLAVERTYKAKGQPDTDFIDIVAFGQPAEFVGTYLDRGALVGVTGRLQVREAEGRDGRKFRNVEVVADTVQHLESRDEARRRRGSAVGNAPRQEPQEQRSAPPPTNPPPMQQAPATGAYNEDEDPFGEI